MSTLRDQILAAEDLPREEVKTDEWAPFGVPFVHVRGLTSAERDAYEMSLTVSGPNGTRIQNPQLKNLRTSFVVRVVVDENGERVFGDRDVDALGAKSSAVIDRLWTIGRRLSGMQLEDDEENPSQGDQEDSNSSGSPSRSESPIPTT